MAADDVRGWTAPNYERAKAVFKSVCEEHRLPQCGSSCTVFKRGVKVVELYAGSNHKGKHFGPDDVSTVQSVSKVIIGLAVAMLEDRGLLKYEDPISKHWPEFGKNGKGNVTIADVLAHVGGLHTLNPKAAKGMESFADRDALGSLLAEQIPDQVGELVYAAFTGGFFISQVIKRVDPKKRYLAEFCREEIFAPLGLNDSIFAGMLSEAMLKDRYCKHATADIQDQVQLFLANSIQRRVSSRPESNDNERSSLQQFLNLKSGPLQEQLVSVDKPVSLFEMLSKSSVDRTEYLSIEGGSFNFVSSSAALAALGDVLARGGSPLISRDGLMRALTIKSSGWDKAFRCPASFTVAGWSPMTEHSDDAGLTNVGRGFFGWWGVGGQLFLFSPERQLSFAFHTIHFNVRCGTRIPAFRLFKTVAECDASLPRSML